jgi:hypothetical protein
MDETQIDEVAVLAALAAPAPSTAAESPCPSVLAHKFAN